MKANQGAAGVDGQSIEEFARDLANNLYKLWNRMSSGIAECLCNSKLESDEMRFLHSGTLLMAMGTSVMLFAATVDLFYGRPGFGPAQISGLVVGAIITLAGLRKLILPRRTILDGVLLAVYFAGLLFMGIKSSGHEVSEIKDMLSMGTVPLFDFVINFFGFSPLGYLMMSYFSGDARLRGKEHAIALTLISGLGISMMLELIQYLIPGRVSSLYDFLANGLGILVGICFYLFGRLLDCRVS